MPKRRSYVVLYLSVVDPLDTGVRTAGDLTYTLPVEACNRLTEHCDQCARDHEILYRIERTPVGTFGNFPVFRINGSKVLCDMSLPIGVLQLPVDAARLEPDETHKIWTSPGNFHEFGALG